MSETGHWTEAWRRDCARVGLADTSIDLGEIKRAYAKTLRVTRPDDDAQAYQDLREAYDRVVAYARQAQARAGDDDDTIALAPPAVPQTRTEIPTSMPTRTHESHKPNDAPPSPDGDRLTEAEHHLLVEQRSPQALCAWTEERVLAGSQAMSEALPELRLELQRLPLASAPEASVRFADLLLRLSGRAPPELVQLLKAHFTWVGDFRVERLLGAHRMEAMHRLLAGRIDPVTDPERQREYAPIVNLSSWLVSRSFLASWRARLAVLLMGHTLLAQMNRAGDALLRRLGLDAKQDHEIRMAALLAYIVHLLLMTAVVWQGMRLGGVEEDRIPGAAYLILINAVGLQAASYGLHLVLDFFQTLAGIKTSKDARRGHKAKVLPWIGVGAFTFAGLIGAVGPMMALSGTEQGGSIFCCFLIGLLLMPLHLPMLTAALLCWAGVMAVLSSFSALWAGLVAAWIAAGMTVLWLDLYVPESEPVTRAQPGWPRGGIGAALALFTVGLPTLLVWLSVRCGQRALVAAFMIAAAVGVTLHEAHRPIWPAALSIHVALAVVLAAQRFGWWAGRRLMARLPGPRG